MKQTVCRALVALLLFASACKSDHPVPVYLSHAYVVVDEATYQQLRASEMLCETFAICDEWVHSNASGETISVLSYYGNSTILEFRTGGGIADHAGAGFVVDEVGQGETIAARLLESSFNLKSRVVNRWFKGTSVPWYRAYYHDQRFVPGFDYWMME